MNWWQTAILVSALGFLITPFIILGILHMVDVWKEVLGRIIKW